MQRPVEDYYVAGEAVAQGRPLGVFAKRVTDIILSGLALLVLWPLFLLIAALVATDGGPILYRHSRVGKDGAAFDCLKFRTMILGATECLDEYLAYHPAEREEWESSRKLTFDPRTTAVGRMLRQTSMDELPQLLNVLCGHMSLVGPRPVTSPELAFYGDKAHLYRAVRPGITGLWQISGRNDVSYAERVDLDARYVKERSFWRDLDILLRTPRVVLSRTGAR
ncbi:MAG: exopolysaccharide production protein ExoY [Verrucomicrobia bacterium]|jgi:exopolysaccharide production protein ExoY|nr:MAG: exopolysaccharide production protein ExoY [Verrucomicrobiota bacterium]